jgi:hypothetical protein
VTTEIVVPAVMIEPKFTAVQVEGDCPKILCDWGDRVVAHLERAHKCEEKAEQHRIAAGQLLTCVIDRCDADGLDAFLKKFCPDLGRSRVFELKAIAAGKKSLGDTRAATRERVARHRAKKASPLQAVTDSPRPRVPDSEPYQAPAVRLPAALAHEQTNGDGDEKGTVVTVCSDVGAGGIPSDPAPAVPASVEPVPARKSKPKPSLVESWESSPEDRAAIRDLVLEDHYALADGRYILSRIRAATKQSERVITDFLDALGVDGMLQAMSDEFGRQLRAKVPAPKSKSDKPKFKTMQATKTASGEFTVHPHGKRPVTH